MDACHSGWLGSESLNCTCLREAFHHIDGIQLAGSPIRWEVAGLGEPHGMQVRPCGQQLLGVLQAAEVLKPLAGQSYMLTLPEAHELLIFLGHHQYITSFGWAGPYACGTPCGQRNTSVRANDVYLHALMA